MDRDDIQRDAQVRPRSIKYNPVTAGLTRAVLRLRTRSLERVLFTATTGRSGTLALSSLFSNLPDTVARHEPYPVMNGDVLWAANYGDAETIDKVYGEIKSINILRAAIGARYYLEANHLFIKSFSKHAIAEFGDRIRIIHLVRPPIEVAQSIYCLGQVPGTAVGNFWWLDHKAPSNILQLADVLESDPEFRHPFYKALWYWHEIEMRIAALKSRKPEVPIIRFETAWMNDPERVSRLLDELGIEHGRVPLTALRGRREHQLNEHKVVSPLSANEAQNMLARFRLLLVDRKCDVSRIDAGSGGSALANSSTAWQNENREARGHRADLLPAEVKWGVEAKAPSRA